MAAVEGIGPAGIGRGSGRSVLVYGWSASVRVRAAIATESGWESE